MNWRRTGITVIMIVIIAGAFYVVGTFVRVDSGRGLSDLTCSDGQIVVFDEPADLWKCADPPAETIAGLSCGDGQIAVFEAASNSWICSPRGYVLLDANDNEIGPVLGIGQGYVVVALTLPDASGTQHAVPLVSRMITFGNWHPSPTGPVYFAQAGCSGQAHIPAHPTFDQPGDYTQLAPTYAFGVLVREGWEDRALYVADLGTTVTFDTTATPPPWPASRTHSMGRAKDSIRPLTDRSSTTIPPAWWPRTCGRSSHRHTGCTSGDPVSRVAGGLDSEQVNRKEMVPRDRIELPTRGFSVRCSTN